MTAEFLAFSGLPETTDHDRNRNQDSRLSPAIAGAYASDAGARHSRRASHRLLILAATHEETLAVVMLEDLERTHPPDRPKGARTCPLLPPLTRKRTHSKGQLSWPRPSLRSRPNRIRHPLAIESGRAPW
jgi:hypothetical protein